MSALTIIEITAAVLVTAAVLLALGLCRAAGDADRAIAARRDRHGLKRP